MPEPPIQQPTLAIAGQPNPWRAQFVDVLTRADNVNNIRVLPLSNGEYALFWLQVIPSSARFTHHYARIDRSGSFTLGPVTLSDFILKHMAIADHRVAAIHQSNKTGTWRSHIAIIDTSDAIPAARLTTQLPLIGLSHGTAAIAWDPRRREWGVVWEAAFYVDEKVRGTGYSRLFFGRIAADGTWIEGSLVPLTRDDKNSETISDWGNPMIWTGAGFALASLHFEQTEVHITLSEISFRSSATKTSRPRVTRTQVATVPVSGGGAIRAVLAHDGRATYGLSWGQHDELPPGRMNGGGSHSNLRFATVRDGEISPQIHLGDDQVYSGEPNIVFDGRRFAVVWNQNAQIWLARIDPTLQAVASGCLSELDFKGTDMVTAMSFDGQRLLVGTMHDINPSQGRVVFVDLTDQP